MHQEGGDTMEQKESRIGDLRYLISYPAGYDSKIKYPAILFLHGSGTIGTDIRVLADNAYFRAVSAFADFPFITFAPQLEQTTWFDVHEQVMALLRHIACCDLADEKRIYVMGASLGGYETWQLAVSMPELIAAIAPICGAGMYSYAFRLANVPVWAFHGQKDDCIDCSDSVRMVDAVNRAGGDAKLTIYPDCGHNAWDRAYSDPGLYSWFLSHENTGAEEVAARYRDSKKYG